MSRRIHFSLIAAASVALMGLSFAACESDDGGNGTADTTGDTTPADTSGGDTSGGDTTANGDTTGGEGACTNAADEAIIEATPTAACDVCEATPDAAGCDSTPCQTPTEVASDCGLSCVLGGDQSAECALNCMIPRTGLSQACAGCYAATVKCTIDACLNECIQDTSAPACITCRDTNCVPAFETCSGINSSSTTE